MSSRTAWRASRLPWMSLMMAFTPGRSGTGPAGHGPPPLARVESDRRGGIRSLYFAPGASVKSAGANGARGGGIREILAHPRAGYAGIPLRPERLAGRLDRGLHVHVGVGGAGERGLELAARQVHPP